MKLFLKIVVGLVVVLGLVLAVILVPAHIQVRGVEPALPSSQQLQSLRSGEGPTSVRYLVTSAQTGEQRSLAHISFLVEWANGKSFLIDTGMSQQQAFEFADLIKAMDSSLQDVQVFGTVASLMGSELSKIQGVGFTHLHIDHTEGIKEFCEARGSGAEVLQTVSQRDLHNFNTSEGAALVADSCLRRGELYAMSPDSGGNDVNIFESSNFPGLAAVELGGHTPGSTLWVVALADRTILFSGDITNDKHSLDHDVAKEALYSWMIVPENIKRTAQLRKWLRGLDERDNFSVIVSHDLKNAQRHIREYSSN